MATFTFGTTVDASHYVEYPAVEITDDNGVVRRVSPRPAAGFILKARKSSDLSALTDITVDGNGQWGPYVLTDIPQIQVSTTGSEPWIPLIAFEAQAAAASAGVDATAALSAANGAVTIADSAAGIAAEALALAQQNGGGSGTVTKVAGVSPDALGNVPLTAGSVGARPTDAPVPAAQVAGLSPVATSGSYADLSNLPAATRVMQNVDGTWPNRPATSAIVTWYTQPGNTTPPASSGTTAGGVGMVANYDIYVEMP